MSLFVDPSAVIYSSSSHEATTFIQAINQYLCLTLSRNAVSPVPQVFDVSVEIFWRVMSGMRTKLKVCVLVFRHFIQLTFRAIPERDRSVIARNFYSHSRNADIDSQAEGCHSCNGI